MKKNTPQSNSISKFKFNFEKFKSLTSILSSFKKPTFKKLKESERYEVISEKLFGEIEKVNAPCFLLPAIIDFIDNLYNSVPIYIII